MKFKKKSYFFELFPFANLAIEMCTIIKTIIARSFKRGLIEGDE